LARAMRPDKTTLAAVAATLALYRAGVATREIPVWRMLAAEPAALEARAQQLAERTTTRGRIDGSAVPVLSTVGGGSLPGQTLPSWGLAVRVRSARRLLDALRAGVPRVIARIEDDAVVLDMRTVDPATDETLAEALSAALGSLPSRGGAR
jgi:L-seryl-tRNA(Ser) seleniumtransferase